MHWMIGIASYVVIWWLVVFILLPIGIRPIPEGELGHAAGAPANPRLPLKFAIAAVIAAVLWLLAYWAVRVNLFDILGS